MANHLFVNGLLQGVRCVERGGQEAPPSSAPHRLQHPGLIVVVRLPRRRGRPDQDVADDDEEDLRSERRGRRAEGVAAAAPARTHHQLAHVVHDDCNLRG